jgi:hypothetical protein
MPKTETTNFDNELKDLGITGANDFNQLSSDKLETILKNLFEGDVRLMQAKVQSVSEEKTKDVQTESKEKTIS